MKKSLCILFSLLIVSAALFAEDAEVISSSFATGRPYWKDFLNMVITLVVILGVVLFSLNLLKKLLNSRMRQLNRTTHIKVLEKRMLGQKSSLYLIEVSGKTFLISESPSGINMLSGVEMKCEEPAEDEYARPPSRNFTHMLQKKMDIFRRKEVSRE